MMLTTLDKDYRETKLLKRADTQLKSPFRELAAWVTATYSVPVLNVTYDDTDPVENRPRLNLILETLEDVSKFKDSPHPNPREQDQRRILEQFKAIVTAQHNSRFKVEKLLVMPVAFEPFAIEEAHGRVTQVDVDRLKARLGNKDLWEISQFSERVTFFFYTDAQVKESEDAGLRHAYAQEYLDVVRRYDEFGYLLRRGVTVRFDSKENFDANYEGNWYSYYN